MAVQIDVDLNTARAEAQAEVFRQKFVKAVGEAADLSGDELKAFGRIAEKQFQDSKKSAEKFGQAVYGALDNVGDAVERFGRSFGGAADKQAQAIAGAIDLGKAGAQLGGAWGAAAGVLIGGIGGAIQKQQQLREEARATLKEITSYIDRLEDASRARERAFGRILRSGNAGAIGSELESVEEGLATSRDKLQDITRKVAEADREAAEAGRGLFRSVSDQAEAELRLQALQKEALILGPKLVGIMALQTAEAERLKLAKKELAEKEIVEERTSRAIAHTLMEGAFAFGKYTGAFKAATVTTKDGTTATRAHTKALKDQRDELTKLIDKSYDAKRAGISAFFDAIQNEPAAEPDHDSALFAMGGSPEAWEKRAEESGEAAMRGLMAGLDWSTMDQPISLFEDRLLSFGATAEQVVGEQIAGAFGRMFDNIEAGDAIFKKGAGGFKLFVGGILRGVGQQAIAQGSLDLLRGAGMALLGNPQGFALMGIGGAELALGAALGATGAGIRRGAGGGRGGGGGGGGTGGAGGSSGLGRSSDRSEAPQAPFTINITWQSLALPDGRELEELGKRIEQSRLAHAKRGGRLVS